jgi:hypothetical protein
MGTGPELDGIIFPYGSGYMSEGGSLLRCPVPGARRPQTREGTGPAVTGTMPRLEGTIFPSSS